MNVNEATVCVMLMNDGIQHAPAIFHIQNGQRLKTDHFFVLLRLYRDRRPDSIPYIRFHLDALIHSIMAQQWCFLDLFVAMH